MNRKAFFALLPLITLAAAVAIFVSSTPTAQADLNGCPDSNTLGNRLPSNLVAARYTVAGNTASYYFDSLVDEDPAGGVPGLIAY